MINIKKIELLAPAADKDVAIQAILHGADAVYMGGPSHGARHKASNSIEDIKYVASYAHQFHAKLYITVNTLIYESELKDVEKMIWAIYRAGADAIIVQDMSILRMNLPPIALHASTQCDIRTVEKAQFLEKVGFSQIVLARELSLKEIKAIVNAVRIPVECFIHGALCVCYSGRCAISQTSLNRSANRGECAQMCRMAYTLRNGKNEIIDSNKYLLSLKDLNTLNQIDELIEAGVTSFKIEGRLKDADYVKNITAAYRAAIDNYIIRYPDEYERSSCGISKITFEPNVNKSFNRGFTNYFLQGRNNNLKIASLRTPKSMGEEISDISQLNNGDGISYFSKSGEYYGVGINKIENGEIISNRVFHLPPGSIIHRTFDRKWQSMISKDTAIRKLWIDISIDEKGVDASDERGNYVRIPLNVEMSEAQKPMKIDDIFRKLGNTIYQLRNFTNNLNESVFIPASQLTDIRRKLIDALDNAAVVTYSCDKRRTEDRGVVYFSDTLDSRDNVANSLSEEFYKSHGVKYIDAANELTKPKHECVVMTTRYCLRRELGCCLKDASVNKKKKERYKAPLHISTGPHTFRLEFDCVNCEMNVIKE